MLAGDGTSLGIEGEPWEAVSGDSGAWGAAGGVRATNGSLVATAAARAHQGLYRCIADNSIGPPLVKHVNVTVHGTV